MEFATSIVGSVAAEIAKYSVEPIGRQFGYLVFYNRNVKNLDKAAKELRDKRIEVQLSVDEAERNLLVIAPSVVDWQKNVDNISEMVREFLESEIKGSRRCLNGRCLDVKSCYSLSRKAKKTTLELVQLRQAAGKFDQIAYPGPPPKMGSLYAEGVKDLDSRLSIMDQVFEALKDDNISIIGISGMAGVGKTTMVKGLVKRVETDLFQEVAMAVVSHDPNVMKIQDEIADRLGLNFKDQKSLAGRAGKLHERLLRSGKGVLIILDDAWKRLDFEELGLPSGGENKRCKIVLTSRSEDVCRQMRSQRIFTIPILSDEEAWSLFREMAGDSIERQDLQPIAKEVADECGGLPLAIVTVARALEGKRKATWDDALRQLRKSKPTNISGFQKDVSSRIELSYNFLESDEAKSCFLLCCLFKEDFDIPIETLVRYGMGLRLFENCDNLYEARNMVHTLIVQLKTSFLLLDGYADESVTMHDVVRDVAISIASKHERPFLVKCDAVMKEWPNKETCKHYAAISLLSKEIKEHPDDLECPTLELLRLSYDYPSQGLPDNFFQGVKELKVLSLDIPSFPESLRVLTNLRTLCLKDFVQGEVSMIGSLVNLEILRISACSLKKLPTEIGLLRNLRLLDLRYCPYLKYIPPGVLSCLSKLEELYMTENFKCCEFTEGKTGEKTNGNTSLVELASHGLYALQIRVQQASLLPKKSVLNLVRFKIFVGEILHLDDDFPYTSKLCLQGDINDVMESGIYSLLKKTEDLILEEINVKNVLNELDKEGFSMLKKLSITNCPELVYMVDAREQIPHAAFPLLEKLSLSGLSNLKEIWHPPGSIQFSCFGKLRNLCFSNCDKLTYVFTLSMARGLQELQCFTVSSGQEMERVFYRKELQDEKITADEIELPKLTDLTLYQLPKLIGFWVAKDNSAAELFHDQQSNDDVAMKPTLNRKVTLENMEELSASQMDKMAKPKHGQVQAECYKSGTRSSLIMVSKLFTSSCPQLSTLKKLKVEDCGFLNVVFSLSVADRLGQLEELTVKGCEKLKYIVAGGPEEKTMGASRIVFHRLNTLELTELPNLVMFCLDPSTFLWPSLKDLLLSKCPKLETFGSAVSDPSMMNLTVGNASTLEEGNSKARTERTSWNRKWSSLRDLLPSERAKMKTHGSAITDPPMMNTTVGHNSNLQAGTSNVKAEHAICSKEAAFNKGKDPFVGQKDNLAETCCAIPSKSVEGLWNLERLKVEGCDALEAVFSVWGLTIDKDSVPALNCLKELMLSDLPKVMHVWDKIAREITGFQNLQRLHVERCQNLVYLFSPRVAKLLVKLQEISITNCNRMEEIVTRTKEETNSNINLLPQLESLTLKDLPNLVGFWPECYGFERPCLENIRVENCPSLEIFGFRIEHLLEQKTVDVKLQDLSGAGGRFTSKPQAILGKVALHSLKILCLRRMNELRSIGHDKLLDGSLRYVTDLEVEDCGNLLHVVPCNLMDSLQKLKKLKVWSCGSMVTIFECEVVNFDRRNALIFPHLEYLGIWRLPKLTHIFHNPKTVYSFPKLRTLEVFRCDSLRSILSLSMAKSLLQLQELNVSECEMLEKIVEFEEADDGGENVVISSHLQKIVLRYLPKLTHTFHNPKIVFGFQTLRKLEVTRCDNLRYIFSVSMAKCLLHLQELQISYCDMLEEVVAKEDEQETKMDTIVFPELKYLSLWHLPNLKSFYSGIYTIELLSLEMATFCDCGKMKTFCYGFLSTPKLEKVEVNRVVLPLIEDLNTTVNRMFKEKVQLCGLKTSHFCLIDFMKSTEHDQLPDSSHFESTDLVVDCCENLANVVPCNLIESLQKLEKMTVLQCDSLVEIFEYEGVDVHRGNALTFSRLQGITLRSLPKLRHIFSNPKTIVAFQNLRKLQVSSCNNLKNIFNVSVARGLIQLQELNIHNCAMLEEIVAKEDEEQIPIMGQIVFRQLRFLRLLWLPNLSSFYGGIYAIELLSLEEVFFFQCDGMNTFSCQSPSTPKLNDVQINHKQQPLMGDLNKILEHFFEEKKAHSDGGVSSDYVHIKSFDAGCKAGVFLRRWECPKC